MKQEEILDELAKILDNSYIEHIKTILTIKYDLFALVDIIAKSYHDATEPNTFKILVTELFILQSEVVKVHLQNYINGPIQGKYADKVFKKLFKDHFGF